MKPPETVRALVDFANIPPDSTELVHHIEEVDIPLADPRQCTHHDTLCAHCAHTWTSQHLFTESLPWGKQYRNTTDP
ncbi:MULTISPECIES: hypothetical protein [Nocardia]|uniref:Uncharacterized protein n=2 Tax=Nocardia TaxID=1817 RepID=A0A846XJQ9_9NOCA|nr:MULTISPECIES: hypothetical protein [Nocardia]MBF6456051.1 hypothetical protein [Nocardia cyriacigeorgica]MBF6553209.1 hypothetical protein [Nocardia cyriacigeorgica]NKY34876.1 hypothetical protein [Nocardia speluncae]TLF77703.1 hypothetical protein FEK34_15500 [Nocardia cyriacigeorgica]